MPASYIPHLCVLDRKIIFSSHVSSRDCHSSL
uniref:Uncharacterized protein n=1 Tax=Rhizophora mucronata TaxID=61149 RepID=A0A2P2QTE4_RHIMU